MNVLSGIFQRTAIGFAVILPLALGAATTSHATAMFSADAVVTITITDIVNSNPVGDPTDLGIFGDVLSFTDVIEDGVASGAASAIVSPEASPPLFDLVPLSIGEGLSINLSVSGTADAIGFADALAAALGIIEIENFSATDTFEVFFDLMVSLSADASLDDPSFEDAFSIADVIIDTASGDVPFDDFVVADALFNFFDPDISSLSSFILVIGPNDFDDVFIDVVADGFAVAIPEASDVAGFLFGLGALGWLRRRPVRRQVS